eukprot:775505-Ditylum_brightwellii.AAC.1
MEKENTSSNTNDQRHAPTGNKIGPNDRVSASVELMMAVHHALSEIHNLVFFMLCKGLICKEMHTTQSGTNNKWKHSFYAEKIGIYDILVDKKEN